MYGENIKDEKISIELYHYYQFSFAKNKGYYRKACQWPDLLNKECHYIKKGCIDCRVMHEVGISAAKAGAVMVKLWRDRMLETKMYKQLKTALNDQGVFLERIENRTGRLPDVYFSSAHNNGLIELKQTAISRGGVVKIPFRPGQYSWIKNHILYNEQIYLIGTIGKEWFIKKGFCIDEKYTIGVGDGLNRLCRVKLTEIVILFLALTK